MMRSLLSLGLLSILSLASAQHHGQFQAKARRHHDRAAALQERANLTERQGQTFQGRATFFYVGLGACGQYSQPSDFMVALNTDQYGDGYPGPQCFKYITITYNGVTQVAQILDECPSCDYGGLDMSQGLFDTFADPSVGEFQMTWWFNDGSGGGGQPATSSTPWVDPAPWTTDQPQTTSTPWVDPAPWTTDQPTTTSQWVDPAPWTTDTPTTTSTPPPPPTTSTTSSSTSTSTTSTSSSTSATSSSSGSVSLAGTPTTLNLAGPAATGDTGTQSEPSDLDNLGALGQLVVNLGNMVVAGGHA